MGIFHYYAIKKGKTTFHPSQATHIDSTLTRVV
jgi:hypothetical protein